MVYTTINVTGNAQLLLAGKPLNPGQLGLGFTLANNDETNTVWVGTKQNMTPTDSGVVPCAPLGSIPIDAGSTTYIVSAGPTVQCFLIPGGGTWAPSPAQVAAQIAALGLATLTAQNTQIGQLSSAPASTIADDVANQGTPLLHGLDLVTALNATLAIPANSTASVTIPQFKKPGYIIQFSISVANAGATAPFAIVQMAWQDPTHTINVGLEKWGVPATSSGQYIITGKGPIKSENLTLSVQNLDPAFAMTLTYTIFETTFHIARDDWRTTNNGGVIPGWTQVVGDPTGNYMILKAPNTNLPGSADQVVLMNLYAGEVFFNIIANSDLHINIGIPAPFPSTFGFNATIYQNLTLTNNSNRVILPRCICFVEIINPTGVALTYGIYGALQEYVS